ncbi:MAG: hypothetical protein ABUL64_00210, partial [Singulisphaera sp.]
MFRFVLLAVVTWLFFSQAAVADDATRRKPVPVADDVYWQEVGSKVASDAPLNSVAVFDKSVYVGTSKGLLRLAGKGFEPVPQVTAGVQRLVAIHDALWAVTAAGLYRLQGGSWKQVSTLAVVDVTEHLGDTVVAAGKKVFKVNGDALEPLLDADGTFPILRVISQCETLYVMGIGRLTFLNGRRLGTQDIYDSKTDQGWDWGNLPSPLTRDALSDGSRLLMATNRGLGVWRGMSLTALRGPNGLCCEDTHCLARGFAEDVWIGTSRGAIRMTEGNFHYFAGLRWLPNDQVNAIAVADKTVYIATAGGLGIIDYKLCTLAAKAAYYEKALVAWGQKRLGLVHKLEWDGPTKQFVREISDNDGGYSCNYLAAQCYRYAVTKDESARHEARNGFQALRWLEAMTGIPGFPARSVWAKGEVGHKAQHGSGGLPAEWHETADGKFEWKGDTSSDELCAQFYATNLFLTHVAQEDEIDQARRHLARIATHLIDHGWKLVDVDGRATRWGRWDPDYFETDEGKYDRGLQCLQLLAFMKSAGAATRDAKFDKAYQQLLDLGYARNTLRQRNTFPPEGVLHFLDELAFWSYWNLLTYERDPALRSIYRRSLERSFEIVRIEQNPWFNFLYGALTGNDCEADKAVRHLRDWPLDLIVWTYINSQRDDLQTPVGYVPLKAGVRTFSPRETQPMRWDHWAMQADGGSG